MENTQINTDTDQTMVIELCNGTIADGREFHAFIQMDAQNYARYQSDLTQDIPMDLPSYGTILHTGWGAMPDQETAIRIFEQSDMPALLAQMGTHAKAIQSILDHNSQPNSAGE